MKKHERGSFRSIHVVLIDSPEFLALKPNAKLMLFILKMRLGPIGIAVVPGMAAALADSTGLTVVQSADALGELESQGWIRSQGNMIWLINGLRYDPAYSAANQWHVQKIKERLAALPKTPLVDEFRQYYADYLGIEKIETEEPVDALLEAELGAFGGKVKPAKQEKARQASWVAEGVAWWTENVGTMNYGRFGKALTPLVSRYEWPRVFVALQEYAQGAEPGKARIEWFAANGVQLLNGKPKRSESRKPQWQIEQEDAGLATAPHVAKAVKDYKHSLGDAGGTWWKVMVAAAKGLNRHPIVYAYEQIPKHE